MRRLVLVTVLVAVGALAVAPVAASDSYSVTPWCDTGSGPQPCASGWYTTPVLVSWTWSPVDGTATSGTCLNQSFAADTNIKLECDVSWTTGTVLKDPYRLLLETSSPSATASVLPGADSNGWFTQPETVSFSGSSFSGIASCTPPTTYPGETIKGNCTDNAGKVASTTVSLNYDPIKPTITGATPSRPPDYRGWYTKPVSFTFEGTDPVSGIQRCQTVEYVGSASGWVTGGCWDNAGNYQSTRVWVSRLTVIGNPAKRAASAPLLLRWKSARHASYYNVQLYRGKRKVLSRWPDGSSLFLAESWRFEGRRFRLRPGRYHWYVWPGYGSRAADRYGRMITAATFTVT